METPPSATTDVADQGGFPLTHWSIIREAGKDSSLNAREAQRIRGLDCYYPVALRGKPCSIDTSPSAHVED